MKFSPILILPKEAPVFDFTGGEITAQVLASPFGIGRYAENRPGIYTAAQYENTRSIHVGIDLFAPIGTEVFSFADGRIFLFDYNSTELDYGYTLITEHDLEGTKLYGLYGHLSKKSLEGKVKGAPIKSGERLAWLGDRTENGGWPPHVHFQLSFVRPEKCDLPGVVSATDLQTALLKYPDPRLVLGPIY